MFHHISVVYGSEFWTAVAQCEQQLAAPLSPPCVAAREVESGEGGLDCKALRHGTFSSEDHASANSV